MNDIIVYVVSMMVMSAFADSHTNSTYPDSLLKNTTIHTPPNEGNHQQQCAFDIGTIYVVFGLTSGLLVYGLILTVLVLVLTCIHLRTKNRLHNVLLKYRHSNINGEAYQTTENPGQETELSPVKATIDAYEEIKEMGTIHCREEENAGMKSDSVDKNINEGATGNDIQKNSDKDMIGTHNTKSNNSNHEDNDHDVTNGSYNNTDITDKEEEKGNNDKEDSDTEVMENENSESHQSSHGDTDLNVSDKGEITENNKTDDKKIKEEDERDETSENDDLTEL